MSRIFLAVFFLLGLGGLAQATLPPKVGDLIVRQAILCDEVDQARGIVQAAQDLGWEDGGQVMLDDFQGNVNSRNEPICLSGRYSGMVTAVESMGLMPYAGGRKLEIWLVSIKVTPDLKGTIIWSNVPGDTTPNQALTPPKAGDKPPLPVPGAPVREA